jgi:hypothetical protein
MQAIKLVIPALYKPHEKVMSKARHILKSMNMLKNTKKNVATVNADMMLMTVVQCENLSYILPKRMLPLISPTPSPSMARRAVFNSSVSDLPS